VFISSSGYVLRQLIVPAARRAAQRSKGLKIL
jgi:hypothetical protein